MSDSSRTSLRSRTIAGSQCAKQVVSLDEAVGRISGETIAAYPPGAPIIAVGEIVSPEVTDYLRCVTSHGAILKGATDPTLRTLKVLTAD